MDSQTRCTPAQTCDTGIAERPRYFPRQIITADDLTLDQEYERARRRLHNRMLHGWGVVCGARVCPIPATSATVPAGCAFEPWKVTVCAGYVLGPYGDEILIDCCRTVDLRTPGTSVQGGDPCPQPPDPWCSPVFRPPVASGPLYVAVRYKQVQARPVRVQPVGCGCDDERCESSRWRDGFDIGVLTTCPADHQGPPALDGGGRPDLNLLVQGEPAECPPCPDQPWVVLARVDLDASGCVTQIDNCACRRNVASFGQFWWACQHAGLKLVDLHAQPPGGVVLGHLAPGTGPIQAQLTFQGMLPASAIASLGPGITVASLVAAGQGAATLTFSVDPGAQPGPRTLTVVDGQCAIATLTGKVAVAGT